MRWRIRWRGGKKVGGYFRSRRRTDLFVALPRTSGTVRAWHKPSTEESLYYVNTTGVLVTDNIGLVQRLMTTAIGRRHGWRQKDRRCGIGEARYRYWCMYYSTRSNADQHTLATMPELDTDDGSKLNTQILTSVRETPLENVILD